MGSPVIKYEKIELLVCIYEISRELVCKYGIYACSRYLTPATIVNPIPSQVHMIIGLDVQDDVKNKLYLLKIQLRQKPVQCTGCSISLPYPKKRQ